MKTLTVPDWLFNILNGIHDNWAVFLAAIVAATIASAVVFTINHKKVRKLADKGLHLLLVAIAMLLTGLQYLIPYLQEHLVSLKTLPYVGAYAVSIYAAANFLYALKYKSWFTAFVAWASKESETVTDAVLETPQPVAADSEFTL